MANARVKIELIGASEVQRTIRGARRETDAAAQAEKKALAETAKAAQKAERDKIRSAQQAAAALKRAADQTAKARTKAEQDAAKAATRAAEAQKREADKMSLHWARLAQKSADVRMRAEERVTKHAAREADKRLRDEEKSVRTRQDATRRTIRGAGGAVGAVVGGVMAGGMAAMGTARGITGTDDVATRVQKANDFRERLIQVSGQAGLDDRQTATVQSQVMSAAMASGKGPDELVGVLESGQAKFNDLKFFANNLEEISKMAKASGSDTAEFATALGYIKQAFGLTGKEAIDAGYKMIQSANKGSIEVKDFARDFASVAGIFQQSTGMQGMAGLNEFLGTSQAAGTLGAGSAETATMVERLVAFMGNPTHIKEIKQRTGIDVRGRSMSNIVSTLADSKKFNKEGVRAEIFGTDIIPNKAIMALISAYRRVQAGKDGAVDISTIAGVEAQGGRDFTTGQMAKFESSGVLDMQRQAIEMQNDTIANLKDYNAQVLALSKASNSLEKSFGTLSLWASAIGVGGAVTGGIGLASKLAGGGAAATAAAGAAGAAGTAAAAGGGALATAGLVAGGAALVGTAGLVGGAVGYGLNEWSASQTGRTISEHIVDSLLGEEVKRSSKRGLDKMPVDGEIKVDVKVSSDGSATATAAVKKSRGARISTSSGPNMPGSL